MSKFWISTELFRFWFRQLWRHSLPRLNVKTLIINFNILPFENLHCFIWYLWYEKTVFSVDFPFKVHHQCINTRSELLLTWAPWSELLLLGGSRINWTPDHVDGMFMPCHHQTTMDAWEPIRWEHESMTSSWTNDGKLKHTSPPHSYIKSINQSTNICCIMPVLKSLLTILPTPWSPHGFMV